MTVALLDDLGNLVGNDGIRAEIVSIRVRLISVFRPGPERSRGRVRARSAKDRDADRGLPGTRVEADSRVRAGSPRLVGAGLRRGRPVVGVHRIIINPARAFHKTRGTLGGRNDAADRLQPARLSENVGRDVPVGHDDKGLAKSIKNTGNAVAWSRPTESIK